VFFKDLRTIVNSIALSMTLFFWTLIAIFLVTYMAALYFTEIMLYRRATLLAGDPNVDLTGINLFRDLPTTFFTLLQSVTGGMDWAEVFDPLIQEIGPEAYVPFLIFLLFMVLAVMNVVTGVFLDKASRNAKDDIEHLALMKARAIFVAADFNASGSISWEDFERVLHHKDVTSFFDALDLDAAEGKTLFDLLDLTGDGTVSADEFLCGCLRLRGSAKALDLLVLSREVTQLCDKNTQAILLNRQMATERKAILQQSWVSVKENKDAITRNYDLLAEVRSMLERFLTVGVGTRQGSRSMDGGAMRAEMEHLEISDVTEPYYIG
jgi:hypothetical protein